MTDKNWNDDFRQRMSEYTENPPEGLWEALKAAGAVGAEEAAGAAGGGLFARLFGRRSAPVWWSLAGVAAAVAAVLILRVPGGPVKVNPADAIIVDNPGAVAQTDIPEAVEAQDPARVQNTPVLPPADGKSSTSGANHPGFAPGSSNRGAVTSVSSGKSSSDVASTDVPAGNGSAASSTDVQAASSSNVSSVAASSDNPAASSSSDLSTAVSTSDLSTAVSTSVISTEAERSGEISNIFLQKLCLFNWFVVFLHLV